MPLDSRQRYEQLEALFSPLLNFKNYREMLEKCAPTSDVMCWQAYTYNRTAHARTTPRTRASTHAHAPALTLRRAKAAARPAFPYLALVLRDITFAHENPSLTPAGLVNFQKLEILGKQIIGTQGYPAVLMEFYFSKTKRH